MLPHLGSHSLPSERMIRCVITSHPAEVMLRGSFPISCAAPTNRPRARGSTAESTTLHVSTSTSAQIARGQVRYMLPHLGSRSLPSERMIRCVITSHPAEVMLRGSFPIPWAAPTNWPRARGSTSLVVRTSTRAAPSSRIDYTTRQYKYFSSVQVVQLKL